MFSNLYSKIVSGIVSTLVAVSSWFGGAPAQIPQEVPFIPQVQEVQFGASIPVPIASFSTSLSSKITSTDTSMSLVSTTTDDGTSLTDGSFYGFVIDVNTPNEEYVLGTASSSNIINMTRGVSVITGNTSVSALKKTHARGASVKIADAPVLLVLARILNGNETVPNKLSYDTSVTTSSFTDAQQIVSKGYADALTFSGAPNASESQKGISQLATQNQLAIGSSTGSTGASLVPQSKWFNTTSSATTTIPVTKTNGKLSQGFLDLTEGFTFGGGVTSTGATVLSGTTTQSGEYTNSASSSFTATTTFTGTVIGATKFGGDGSDGDFTATSTTFNLNSASYYVKNFNNISITGTSSVSFSNPSATGTIVIFKAKGSCVITSASSTAIDLRLLGGTAGSAGGGGGAGGRGAGSFYLECLNDLTSSSTINASGQNGTVGQSTVACVAGSAGNNGVASLFMSKSGVGGACFGGGTGGTSVTINSSPLNIALSFVSKILGLGTGAGGGGGSSVGSGCGGGGGGGGGGIILLSYGRNLISNTGTYNINGGTGGLNSSGGGAGCGGNIVGGGGGASFINDGISSGINGGGYSGDGGNGGNGNSTVIKNISF